MRVLYIYINVSKRQRQKKSFMPKQISFFGWKVFTSLQELVCRKKEKSNVDYIILVVVAINHLR